MKKLLGFMSLMFVLTIQDTYGIHHPCVPNDGNAGRACIKECASHGTINSILYPGSLNKARELGIENEYNKCIGPWGKGPVGVMCLCKQ